MNGALRHPRSKWRDKGACVARQCCCDGGVVAQAGQLREETNVRRSNGSEHLVHGEVVHAA